MEIWLIKMNFISFFDGLTRTILARGWRRGWGSWVIEQLIGFLAFLQLDTFLLKKKSSAKACAEVPALRELIIYRINSSQ